MIPTTLASFMGKLFSETEKGNFQWFPSEQDSYFCNHKEFTLHISRYYDPDREIDSFHFNLINGLVQSPFSVYDTESDYSFMRNFFQAVIMNANGIARALDGFFD